MNNYNVDSFLSYTIGILVFFIGVHLNKKFSVLRNFNIPEPVTGGLIAALIVFAIYLIADVEIQFELDTRDRLLVYFFTAIGLNARLSDLIDGGKPLFILLVLTLSFIVIQNVIGLAGAQLVGVPSEVGVLAGSMSLIGGHGTAIAWAPEVSKQGISNAMEIGVASATLGLVLASLIGGPIARFLLKKYQLSGKREEEVEASVGIAYDQTESINHLNIMAVLLTLHIAIILGYLANQAIAEAGFKLPLFVTCLLTAILLSNSIPRIMPKIHWPAHTRALALVSDFSLGLFLAMSLMSMQLWTIAELAGSLLIILILQTAIAIMFILWILFPLMGKNYQAAVLSAGFGGFALGATPTAIANMTAVTKANGPAPTAFIILPLVAAFFVDVANAFVIRMALAM
ncbi:sodium/glutamate symporter [Aliikangiella coralliicola]|uniref:Sodium/glutamate symporter n=1 Tax=Aliikangiella coralliicola TaxID=2592383 RepID=A0A545U910_9GAMM|nr:sodium/glutamate symporter [Aliikangiella coralliicola]TQV85957.1 sodium/glutamate symporter [Aliikangiella coralliicola]